MKEYNMHSFSAYIITQNKDYFLSSEKNSQKKSISVKNKDLKKLMIFKECEIFLYDYDNKKLYGPYAIEYNSYSKSKKENYCEICIMATGKRRGIYYEGEIKNKDFYVYEIDYNLYLKINSALSILNSPLSQTFLSCSIEKGLFKYTAVETYPYLYVSEYEKQFDKKAYESIYREYKELSLIPNSENMFTQKYKEIGNALMNMFIPEKDLAEHLTENFKIVYLYLNKETYFIPWEIFSYKEKFLSETVLFSFMHTKNVSYSIKYRAKKTNMAIISIPQQDIENSYKEIDILSRNKEANIDVYVKPHNYFEFIKIMENYDIVHIITHGKEEGIVLSDEYILKSVGALQNPPSLVFINSCRNENGNLIKSMSYAGVKNIVAGVGNILDGSYLDFIEYFYNILLNKCTRVNTSLAYYFASLKFSEKYKIFLKYRFYGATNYV